MLFEVCFTFPGSAVAVYRLFQKSEDSIRWFSISQLCIYLGGFVGPLIVRPYLAENKQLLVNQTQGAINHGQDFGKQILNLSPEDGFLTENRTLDTSIHGQDLVLQDFIREQILDTLDQDQSSNIQKFNPFPHDDTSVMYGFTIAALIMFFTGVLMFLAGGYLRGVNFRSPPDQKEDFEIVGTGQHLRRCFIVLLLLFSLIQSQYIRGFTSYLAVFVVDYLRWSKSSGAILTSVMFLSFAVFRIISIFIKIRSIFQIFFGLLLCTVASILLSVFVQYHDAVIWTCTILLGIGYSAVLSAKLSWISDTTGDVGHLAVMSALANLIGEAAFSPLIAYLLENISYLSLLYMTAVSTGTGLLLMVLMQCVAWCYKLIGLRIMIGLLEEYIEDSEKRPLLSETSHHQTYT